MRLDEAVLEELERGGGTVKEIGERLSGRIQHALDRLVGAKKVIKDGYPGKGNQKAYSLPQEPPINRRF